MTQKWQFVHLLDPLQGSQFNLYLVTERHKYGFSKQINTQRYILSVDNITLIFYGIANI